MQSKTPSLFDQIYNAALQGDISTLNSLYKRNQTLDVCCKSDTPSSRLAGEGNINALNHLQNFPLNISWVAQGLAKSGNVAAAFECVAKHGADINKVAMGLAWGGDVAAALACVAERGAQINWVAHGLALGGYAAAAFECVDNRGADIYEVAKGLASGGDVDAALKFVAERGGHINWVAQGLAAGGYVDAALECVTERGVSINQVADGLAKGGDVEAALVCVAQRGADINWVARGLAEGGYVEAAIACVDQCFAEISWVAQGLARGGHVEVALACVAQREADITWVGRGLAAGGYCRTNSILLRTLQVCHTHDVRKKLVIALGQIKSTVITLPIKLDAQTLALSNKIAERISNYQLSFNQAEAWLTNKDLRMMLLYFRPKHLFSANTDCFYLVCQQLCHGNLTQHDIKNLYAQVRFNLDKALLMRALQSKAPSLFDQIYSAALQGDISTLRSIYKSNKTLDVCCKFDTPSSRLAAEGNSNALKHLQNFPININWVARGLALGGQVEAALACVAQHGAHINTVAQGLAEGGYLAAAFECVAQRGAHINGVAFGLARGGCVAAAFECVAKRRANIKEVAQGLAAGGQVEAALACVAQHGANINWVAQGLARSGQVEAALASVVQRDANINEVAFDLAQGGYVEAALVCVAQRGADISQVAQGLVLGGYLRAALACVAKRGADINEVAYGLVQRGYLEAALVCVTQHGAHLNGVARGLARGGYCKTTSILLRTLQRCPTSDVRKMLVTALKQEKAKDNHLAIQLEAQTLTLSNKIAKRIANYKLPFHQAHAWLTNRDLRMMLLYFKPIQLFSQNPDCFYLVCQQLCDGNITVNDIKFLYAQIRFNLQDKAPLVRALKEEYVGTGIKGLLNNVSGFFNQSTVKDARNLLANCKSVPSKEDLVVLLQQTLDQQLKKSELDRDGNPTTNPLVKLLIKHLNRLTQNNQAEVDSDSEMMIGYNY